MRPFWLDQALAVETEAPAPPLARDRRVDVCIVGGGYTGLWTAIMLREQAPGLQVALVEADICGAGASGRNGGCVLGWASKYPTLRRLFGEEEARRLVVESERCVGRSATSVAITASMPSSARMAPCSPRPIRLSRQRCRP